MLSSSLFLPIVLLSLALLCVVVVSNVEYDFAPCAEPRFKRNGHIDLDSILYECANNTPSSLFPPSYFPDVHGVYHSTNVSVQIALNNIIRVDDVSSQFTLDFFFRLIWTDPRLVLPEAVWTSMRNQTAEEGLEISSYFDLQEPVKFWLPDIYFTQGTDIRVLSKLVKLQKNGLMFWARQMIVTFANPEMPFFNFPNDEQTFTVAVESFAYDSDFIQLNFRKNDNGGDNPVVFLPDFQRNELPLVETNQIWRFQDYGGTLRTTDAPSPTNKQRKFSTAFINLRFARQSRGVIFRLALPVLIFLVIVGASFWSDESDRMEVTLQIILVVSALYVIIGQSIPFVGYLTKMDMFIVAVFVMLAVTITVHFCTTLLSRKAKKYPLNTFVREFLVTIFRGLWIPLSVGIFLLLFGMVHEVFFAILALALLTSLFFLNGKMGLVKRSWMLAMVKLNVKCELVEAGAIDDKTELPLKLSMSELIALKVSECLCISPFSTANSAAQTKVPPAKVNGSNVNAVDIEKKDNIQTRFPMWDWIRKYKLGALLRSEQRKSMIAQRVAAVGAQRPHSVGPGPILRRRLHKERSRNADFYQPTGDAPRVLNRHKSRRSVNDIAAETATDLIVDAEPQLRSSSLSQASAEPHTHLHGEEIERDRSSLTWSEDQQRTYCDDEKDDVERAVRPHEYTMVGDDDNAKEAAFEVNTAGRNDRVEQDDEDNMSTSVDEQTELYEFRCAIAKEMGAVFHSADHLKRFTQIQHH